MEPSQPICHSKPRYLATIGYEEKDLKPTTKAWLRRASGASNQAKNVKTSCLETVVPARRLAPKNPPSKITSLTYGTASDGTRINIMKTTRAANQQQISLQTINIS